MGIWNKTNNGSMPMPVPQNRNPRQPNRRPSTPAHGNLDDLLWLHKSSGPSDYDHIESLAQDTLDSQTFADLFNKTFPRLDPENRGITKEHLGKLIMRPDIFANDEYVMLLLLAKYYDTISNLVDGDTHRITSLHKEVLSTFLIHGKLTLAELARWRMLGSESLDSGDLPPLSKGA